MAMEFEIEKFNGSNFGLWKMKMKAILRKENCLETISERLENVEDKKWEQMDGNVVANLHLVVANSILSSISELQSTKEIWDTLTNLYDAKLLHNKIFLKRKLYALQMLESTLVIEHISTLKTLFSQLSVMEHYIEE